MNNSLFEGQVGAWIRKMVLVTCVFLAAFLGVEVVSGLMSLKYVGTGIAATNTIVVSGHGEMLAVPDVATFSFSVVSDKASVADAQSDATTKANTLTIYLKSAGIDEKDIQTTDYSIQPQYEYQNATCPQVAPVSVGAPNGGSAIYCPSGRQVLKGYEVRQTTTVKVRDTKKAGDTLAGVGGKGATEVSGLQFVFDDPTAVQTGARDKAITDAKEKAEALAKQLGVSLVRVVSFNENGAGGQPAPMAYSMAMGATADKAATPEISVGQNKVTDDVSITYEIR
ncbi:MAG: SIMPL domain-containing protein [bacterium]